MASPESSAEKPPQGTLVADVAKLTVGAFAGATFAFCLASYRDRCLRIREQKAAGNMAMTILIRQFLEMSKLRDEIEAERQRVRAASATTPPKWMEIRPIPVEFNDALRFDLQSLDFLFEHRQAELVEQLIVAEGNYHSLGLYIREHRVVTQECQDIIATKAAEENVDPHREVSVAHLESFIGFARRERVSSLVASIDSQLATLPAHEKSITALHEGLVGIFGKKGILRAELQNAGRQMGRPDSAR